jgi:hypothetical protein
VSTVEKLERAYQERHAEINADPNLNFEKKQRAIRRAWVTKENKKRELEKREVA